MSLRIFHICFIIMSTLLMAGVAWWCFANEMKILGGVFVAGACILPPYGIWFLRKSRKLV